jgi:heterodisulfide reductase subunit A-like polyferredoxin
VADIVVIGGGLTGLAAAAMLSPFHTVTLLETTDTLGGLGGTLSCKAGVDCTVCTACTLPEMVEWVLADENVTVRTGVDLREEDLEADATIVATGLDVADGSQLSEYGIGRFTNVVTALEMDRRLRTEGAAALGEQPLDGRPAGGRVAIVQCVCSRDTGTLPYCSRVCCGYSARLALELRQMYPDVEVDVFYMDIQREDAVGSAQIDQAMGTKGIEYIRSRPAAVNEVPGGGLEVLYEDTIEGEIMTREYGMVVLSTGLVPSEGTAYLATRLDLSTDDYGFIVTDPEHPTRTSVPTVMAAGGATGPVDLVEASMGGMAAAAAVLTDHPPEWSGHPPRVIVVGEGPVAKDACSVVEAAGADTVLVGDGPGKGLRRLEGEPLDFLALMDEPGSETELKGDMVIVVPERMGGVYEPVPEDADSVAIVMSEGPEALLLAANILETLPNIHLDVLFQEMQVATMGMQELQMELANMGVGFYRYGRGSLRVGEGPDGALEVRFVDVLVPEAGEVTLSVSHVARPGQRERTDLVWPWFLSRHAPRGVPTGRRLNLLPVLTPRRGVYTTTPATTTSTASALGGQAAAAMALSDYAWGFPIMEEVAVVDPDLCAACLNCLRVCPHDAIVFDEEARAAVVMTRACQDCGLCRGICPAEAIDLVPSDQLEVDE